MNNKLLGKITLINPHIIVAYVVVIVFFSLIFCIDTPLISAEPHERQDFFQRSGIGEILTYYFFITFAYFLSVYFLFNTMSGNVVLQYFRFQIMQGVKEISQEYQLKDLAHEEVVGGYEHRRKMKELEHLRELVKIKHQKAVTSIEKAKARLLDESVKYLDKMTPRWHAYIIACLSGSKGTMEEDKDLEEEINRIKKDIEAENLRKATLDNDEQQRKHEANKRPPPDV